MFDLDELLEAYRVSDRGRARVRANFIASLDGAATVGGLSGGLNDPWDLQVFTVLRRLADVVLVGAGTLRAEGYGGLRVGAADVAWRREHGLSDHPRLAIATRSARLDPASDLFAGAPVPPLVYAPTPPTGASDDGTGERLEALAGVAEVITLPGEVLDVHAMLAHLAAAGHPQVLCEGGPHLFGSLIDADAVDELCLTLAPVLAGGTAPRISATVAESTRAMRLVHALPGGPMLFLRYERETQP
ncbi:pyrimidine reductase family protein [Pseudactinotalea sp. HY158]|uniref:pyrimidine reductase family protein n=1 Tax=Pseudactinotalea sp. HY158 TaxID=2654547 RepID=UPI00129C1C55|nr:pyrimidine reductase family protein [Pseudactinotalea sp. HY158]QGH68646.1 pyrimidine reductase family protein [Pseudactinotalea sp. HY158]